MKRIHLLILLLVGIAASVQAQLPLQQSSWVFFDASDGNGIISTNGFGSIGPLYQDVNATLLGGPDANHLTQMVTLLLSVPANTDGTAIGDITDFAGTPGAPYSKPGVFFDNSGLSYVVPGVAQGGIGTFEVEIWLGNYPSYQAAFQANGGLYTGSSGPFQNPTARFGLPVPSLIDMPSFYLFVPEPSTLALAGAGAAALLISRRRAR